MCDSFPPKRQKSYMSLSAVGSLSSKATPMLLTLARALPIVAKPGLPARPTWKNRKLKLNFTEVFDGTRLCIVPGCTAKSRKWNGKVELAAFNQNARG